MVICEYATQDLDNSAQLTWFMIGRMEVIMYSIEKFNETMTSKERVAKTFNLEKTDRVTIGYDSNPLIHQKLCSALGCDHGNMVELYKILGVDYIGCEIPYIGKPIYPEIPNRRRSIENGSVTRYIENEYGGYEDYCDFPLADVDDEVVANYPFTDPDDYDYDYAVARIDRLIDEGFAIHVGNPGHGDILNSTGMLMSYENALVKFMIDDEATGIMTDRRIARDIAKMERVLERAKGKIDFMWLGEDLGTQHSPLVSMDFYRDALKSRHMKFIDLAKAYNLPVIIHTCGSSSWVYEEMIEMGITAVDTLQPEATNMSPQYLTDTFGGRLAFRGCISTAGELAYGTKEDVERVCKKTLEIMMPNYGYHFAPTHSIQDNTPVENIVAMYQSAHKYGRYM